MSDDPFFRVEAKSNIIWFRVSEIVAVERPNWPMRPSYWPETQAAVVYLRHRELVSLDFVQWKALASLICPEDDAGTWGYVETDGKYKMIRLDKEIAPCN